MAEFDLTTIKRKMLRKFPAFGSIISSVKYQIVDDIRHTQTAATDGKTIYCNKNFLNSLSEDEQLFVFSHEVCHIALNHIMRSDGKDPRLWNIATDAVINQHLIKDGLPMVEGGVDIKNALQYDAEELYQKLLAKQQKMQQENGQQQRCQQSRQSDNGEQQSGQQCGQSGNSQQNDNNQQQNGQSGQQSGQNGNNQQQGSQSGNSNSSASQNGEDVNSAQVGHDEHSMWEEAVKQAKQEQENKSNNSGKNADDDTKEKQSDANGQGSQKDKENTNNNENGQQNQGAISEKDAFKKNEEEKIKRAEEVMSKLSTERRGVGGGSQEVYFDSVGKAKKAVVNWKRLLKQTLEKEVEVWGHRFSDRESGWRARIEDVEYDEDAETEIILDTSGSVSVGLLKSFLRQVKTILKDSKIKVGTFDDKFYSFVEIKKESDIDKLRLHVGGGTNFDAASRAFSKRKDVNRICFTDGWDGGDAGIREKRKDIVWICFENPKFKPDNGKVIFVPASQIQECEYTDGYSF